MVESGLIPGTAIIAEDEDEVDDQGGAVATEEEDEDMRASLCEALCEGGNRVEE